MGRYFGREPRYSREEIERQAQEAIDARVSMGRPPEEDFRPLQERLSEIDGALAARPPVPPVPPVPAPEPLQLREIRMPQAPQAEAPAPAPKVGPRAARRPVAARSRSN